MMFACSRHSAPYPLLPFLLLSLGALSHFTVAFPPHHHAVQAQLSDPAYAADNMKRLSEVYTLAQQFMNLGGNILNNAQSGAGGGTAASRAAHSTASSLDGGNGVLGEVVRPQFRGVPSYEPQAPAARSLLDGGSRGGGNGGLFSEYGGGPLGMGSRSQPRSILDSLMGSFLGSSLSGNERGSLISSVFSPSYDGDDYGGTRARYGGTKQGSNIEAIVDALSRRGVKKGEPAEGDGGPASFLSQLFGG